MQSGEIIPTRNAELGDGPGLIFRSQNEGKATVDEEDGFDIARVEVLCNTDEDLVRKVGEGFC